MKFIKLLIVSLFCTAMIIPFSVKPAAAMDFIIGAKAGYFAWDPYMKRMGFDEFEKIKLGTGILYGPVFSAIFTPDLSLSLSGLFGRQSSAWMAEDVYGTGSSTPRAGSYSLDVGRIDLDSALSYRLTENFKILAGYKYQSFDVSFDSTTYEGSGVQTIRKSEMDNPMYLHGPALGVGFSTPIGDRYFFAGNLSALYMWGKFDFADDAFKVNGMTGAKTSDDRKFTGIKVVSRGLSIEPTVGASMGDGMPVFTLGIRGQWSQTKMPDAEKISVKEKWMNDYQYGVFVSVLQPF